VPFVSNSSTKPFRPLVAALWKLIVRTMAIAGFVWMAGGPVSRLVLSPLFVTDVVHRAYSPDRLAVAEVEVRRGGLGTVWTTRVHLKSTTKRRWTIYKAKDSDFVPPLRWLDRTTLLIGLPCGRFDHLSNPDDWESVEPRQERLRVWFERPADC
jgi:hypothetical protein